MLNCNDTTGACTICLKFTITSWRDEQFGYFRLISGVSVSEKFLLESEVVLQREICPFLKQDIYIYARHFFFLFMKQIEPNLLICLLNTTYVDFARKGRRTVASTEGKMCSTIQILIVLMAMQRLASLSHSWLHSA